MRIGLGVDAHPFEEGRPLVLGGVEVAHPQGLSGHSDGDVLLHAIIDALLGAAGQGDIGEHFPSSDARLAGVSSSSLLTRTLDLLQEAGLRVVNVDATIIAERPRLSPYRDRMQYSIAQALRLQTSRVNVKFTTTDGLGPTGQGEGIAAYAIAAVEET